MAKKKYYPFFVTSRLVQDEDFKYSSKYGMMYWLADNRNKTSLSLGLNDKSLAEYLREARQNSMAYKFERLYHRTKTNEKYRYCKPHSSLIYDYEEQVKQVCLKELKKYISHIDEEVYYIKGELNLFHAVWQHFINQCGYSFKTNQFTGLSLVESCYLKSAQVYYNSSELDGDSLSNLGLAFDWGITPNREQDITREYLPAVASNHFYVVFDVVWEELESYTELNPQTNTNETKTRTVLKEATVQHDLNYLYPEVIDGQEVTDELTNDNVQFMVLSQGEYRLFTFNVGDITSQLESVAQASELYPRIYTRVAKRDIEGSGFSYEKVNARLIQMLGDTQKGFTKKVNTGLGEHEGITEYCFLTPALAINRDGNDSAVAEYCFKYFDKLYGFTEPYDNGTQGMRKGLTQVVKDEIYTQIFSFHFIHKGIQQGKFLDVGKYKCTMGSGIYNKVMNFLGVVHTIQHQITETECVVISVFGLSSNSLFSGHSRVASNLDEHLLIPVDRTIIKSLSPNEKEKFFSKALNINVSMVKVVKKKWYQTGVFKVVLAVIAAIISYFVPPAGVAAYSMLAVVVGMIYGLALGILIQLAVKLAVKLGLNAKIATIIAVIVQIIFARGQGINFNVITVMNILNNTFNIYTKMMTEQIRQVQKEMQGWISEANAQSKELKEKIKQLGLTGVIPMDLELLLGAYQPPIRIGESPSDFYDRSLMTGYGSIVLEYATSYHDSMKSLPSIQSVFQTNQINFLDNGDLLWLQ